MVKGVSRTIIEVNNTGSRLFEKIVFYVTPEYGNLSAKQLKRAASEFSFNYDKSVGKKSLRKRCKLRKDVKLLAAFLSSLAVLAGILLIIL